MQEPLPDNQTVRSQYRAVALVSAVAVVLALPLLESGFAMDDYWLFAKLTPSDPKLATPVWDLFELWPIPLDEEESLEVPWFADPKAKMHFFRPLSSLAFALDAWLFGDDAFFPLVNAGMKTIAGPSGYYSASTSLYLHFYFRFDATRTACSLKCKTVPRGVLATHLRGMETNSYL